MAEWLIHGIVMLNNSYVHKGFDEQQKKVMKKTFWETELFHK